MQSFTATSGGMPHRGLPLLLLVLVALSWIGTISASIRFTLPNGLTYKPNDFVPLNWTLIKPVANGIDNTNPFTVILRAASGQRYEIQSNVVQAALTVKVRIPAAATGGPHSFYAYYVGGDKSSGSSQFNITGPIVTITPPAGTDAPDAPDAPATPETTNAPATSADTGISGGMLAGIIGGAVVVLLATAMLFISRHRRRVADAKHETRSMEDIKEPGFTSGPGAYGSKDQDKESLTRSAGSGGGPVDGEMVAVPLNGGSGPRPQRPDQSSQAQYQMNPMQHPSSATKNPFDNPEAMIPPVAMSPRQQQQQAHQYQPPQLPPLGSNSPMMVPSPNAHAQQQQQQQQLQRNQQGNRDSFESEIESAYDPSRTRAANNGNNASPVPQTPVQAQNPFTQPEHEITAVAATVTAAASPVQGHRQLQDLRSPSPVSRPAASPRMKEIEMQHVQQHHLEQQQKMLQRQQQQQQQQQQEQQQEQQQPDAPSAAPASALPAPPILPAPPAPSGPMPAAQNSIDPTQFDDKAEVEEDKMPAYNGYRDTIFGAYAQVQDDDDDEEESIPAVPALTAAAQALAGNNGQPPSDRTSTGGAEIQRKKSVKFTGVPPSGPIVLPNNEAAKEHQAQRQQRHQQQEKQRPISEAEFTEGEGDDSTDEEDEDDIKVQLMQNDVPNPVPDSPTRPQVDTSLSSGSSPNENTLSPVRSPDQGFPSHMAGFVPPPPAQQQPPSMSTTAPSDMEAGSLFGQGFYEDVLAAVERTVPSPPTSTPLPAPPNFIKPVMPLVPRVPSPPPTEPTPLPQQFVQQQHIPAPQPQHIQPVPVTEQVFGAPSPRVAPASKNVHSNKLQTFPSPPMSSATVPDSSNNNGVQNSSAFYEGSLL
ncbi:hypothetical protein BGZ65_002315 [Modicella reniformis]|uniref:Uncharacterized protein n=1 Tax=Modicella reniformis TaxID=1440133 RepID=A0A9P6J0Z6_9FUNG|nr:hypothetical protein BGZ65_002315 [Modicella reniformis]